MKTRGCEVRSVLVNDVIICVPFFRRSIVVLGICEAKTMGGAGGLHKKCILIALPGSKEGCSGRPTHCLLAVGIVELNTPAC